MKFLCDRCKTRYSIADERVRGKILKIRCKNCSAVITVREGMEEPADWAAPAPTAATPPSPAPSAPVRPPPASLHEEWYVSLDGNQEGPFLLPEAQAWVTAKSPDDELHCWCEGFDDWLPVEKVSHFRGLRGKVTRARTPSGVRPAVEGTPPLVTQPARQPPAPEPEPKPLFAATLAALEADAQKEAAAKEPKPVAAAPAPAKPLPGAGTGSLPRLSPMATRSTPAAGHAKVNAPPIPKAATPAVGVPKVATPAIGVPKVATPAIGVPKVATPAAAPPPLPMPPPLPATPPAPRVGAGLPPVQALTGPSGAPLPSASSSTSIPRPAPMFDTGPVDDDTGASAPAADEPEAPVNGDPVDDMDDDLSIGEVSRVVRLADLANAMPARKAPAPAPAPAAAAAAVARNATGSTAAIARGTGMVARIEPAEGAAAPADEGAPASYQPAVAVPPRRRTLLYVGAAVVAIALSAIVALVATSGGASDDDQIAGTTRKYADLGGTVDNPFVPRTRPNDEVDAGVGAGTSSGGRRPTGSGKTPTGNGSSSGSQSASGAGPATGNPQIGPDGQPLRPLSPDDVFAMSSKMEIGTRRCYERALKEDPFLKVSKIKAMITVKNTGVVSNVTLSSMQGTPLATCLSAAIGRWRFRPSTEGIVSEFALVFEQR